MKSFFLITLIFIANLTFGQETGTYQSDSIYKANKVKARLWYLGTNKKLSVTTFYDTNGRLIKYQLEPFIGGEQLTTHYTYDLNGRLIAMVDTIKKGEPNKEAIEELKKAGLLSDMFIKNDNNKPSLEVAKYELTYSGEQLTKIIKYNPDESLDIIDKIENNGKKQIRDWYRDGELIEQCTTEYLNEYHKEKFYGWEIINGKKITWDYTFKYKFENGRVKNFVRYEGKKEMEKTEYFYDEKGLLIKVEGYTPEFFEYLYY